MKRLLASLLILAGPGPGMATVRATPSIGPWIPLFQGVDRAVGTNLPAGNMPNQHVVQIIRVDLGNPDVRLFTSPRMEPHVFEAAETEGYTVSDFLSRHRLQVAVNADLFSPSTYYLPAGTPMDIGGLSVCEGVVVSRQEGPDNSATIVFNAANEPTLIPTNWPAASTEGVYTAVSGSYPLMVGGVNLGAQYLGDRDFIHRTNPRTVLGFSRERKVLFIVAIDGRQPGYSVGANDYESGAWLEFLGATDGVNLDGGGSTTLVVEDSLGGAVRLNRSSAVADSGKERTVGSHLGIYTQPLRGFLNDVAVASDDTFATIHWTTTAPAASAVRYGTNLDLAERSADSAAMVTDHDVLLTGLVPATRYYFEAVSWDGTADHVSTPRTFVTSNYVSTATLFDVTQPWRYSVENLDGMAWADPGYEDSGWAGPGPGLLWVDGRGGPRAGVEPANTPLPIDSAGTGFPYPTYYFRTHFDFPAEPEGASLLFTTFIDDGAVFYLNGVEVWRLRMEDAPAVIVNDALAAGFGCAGDATCGEAFTISGAGISALRHGDNVLAVEVHNYNARSPDTTFGVALDYTVPIVVRPVLEVQRGGATLTLRWQRSGFALQKAGRAAGPWTDVDGPVVTSPYSVPVAESEGFYRLRKL